MRSHCLLPQNLAAFGVKRQGDGMAADLLTIWKTTYPVITNYKKVMARVGWVPFAGGTMDYQGPRTLQGFITSGYRDQLIEGRKNSPHLYAIALDFGVGPPKEQARVARLASDLFYRIGLYPDNGFIHVDLMPSDWIRRYNAARYWVRKNGVYRPFDNLDNAIIYSGG